MAKKRINSKQKGSEYERKIAKVLGDWFQEEFHRVPMSGGLRWGEDTRVVGDITTSPDSLFPFTVECKKRQEWDLEQVLKGTGDVNKWWEQALGDSMRVKTIPMLIFAKNFSPNYIMIDHDIFNTILSHKGVTSAPFNYFVIHTEEMVRVVCQLDKFIESITRNDIIGALVNEK